MLEKKKRPKYPNKIFRRGAYEYSTEVHHESETVIIVFSAT